MSSESVTVRTRPITSYRDEGWGKDKDIYTFLTINPLMWGVI